MHLIDFAKFLMMQTVKYREILRGKKAKQENNTFDRFCQVLKAADTVEHDKVSQGKKTS